MFLLIKRSIRLGHTYCVISMSHLYAQYIHKYGSEIRGTIHAQELKQSIQISWSPNQYMQFGLLWWAWLLPSGVQRENLDDKNTGSAYTIVMPLWCIACTLYGSCMPCFGLWSVIILTVVVKHYSPCFCSRVLQNAIELNQQGQQTWLTRVRNILQDADLNYIWQNPWDVYHPEAIGIQNQ